MKHTTERSREELLSALLDIATDLTMLKDVEIVLQTIAQRTRRLIGSDMAYISMTDFERHQTYINQSDGVATHAYRTLVQPLGTGVLGQVALGLAPYQTSDYLVDDTLNRVEHIDEVVRAEGVRAIMGVPLKVAGRVIGALVVAERSPRQFSLEEIDIVDSIGKQAAVAIDNSMRFEQLRTLTDSLAGEQKRSAAELSVITRILDLDARLMESVMIEPDVRRILDIGRALISADLVFQGPSGTIITSTESSATAAPPAVELPTGIDPAEYTPVMAAGEELGRILAARQLDEPEQGLLERVAVHAALAILFLRAERDADSRRQAEFLSELFAGRSAAVDHAELRFKRWGIMPGAPLWCISIAVPSDDFKHRLLEFKPLSENSVMLLHDDHACLVTSVDDWEIKLRAFFARQGWRLQAGTSGAVAIPRHLPDAHRSSLFALGSLQSLGRDGIADGAEFGMVGALLELGRRGELPGHLTASVTPIIDYDAARGTELTRTALLFLETDANVRRTSELLFVHRNTVRQRLERIDQLLGTGWSVSPRRLEIHLALHAHNARVGLLKK